MKIVLAIMLFLTVSCGSKKTVEVPATVFPGGSEGIPTAPPSAALPPLPPAQNGFISLEAMEDAILLDLQARPSDTDRQSTRYLIGCDQYNQSLSLSGFEQGVNKGINMLSTARFLKKVTPIGKGNCIFRIDIRDYNISKNEWTIVEKNLQLQFVSQTIRNKNLQFLTQTQKPFIFANDFMLTAFESDAVADKKCVVYCDIVDEPLELAAFFEKQGVVVQREFNEQNALLAGFSQSQIALGKTRLVQVVESTDGYCLTTFDVSLSAQDSIFTNPFTLESANANGVVRSDKIYKQNAQEHICTLPNGLFALWRLNGAAGKAEVAAPNDVVINTQFASIDPTIRIGDCAGCHHTEVAIPFKDQVRQHVRSNAAFNDQEKLIAEIFYNNDRIQAISSEINKLHRKSLTELSITDTEDPFNNKVVRPLRIEMNASQVAGFTFLDTQDFLEVLRGTSKSSQTLGNLLNGGTVSLGTLKEAFPVMVTEMNLFRDRQL